MTIAWDKEKVLVAGGAGFIGHHLVKFLVGKGYWVRVVDLKRPEFEPSPAQEFKIADLRDWGNCLEATKGVSQVYSLAADMGGIGWISTYHASIARGNVLINANMLEASRINDISSYLYTSSACVYPQYKQATPDVAPLKEEGAYPADPEEGYGWEKLFSEKLCQYYHQDYGLNTHIVRLHNVMGPLGTYEGGREKAPAAICRKIALARNGGEIEVWGDGLATRSFLYIDDCLEGLYLTMNSDYHLPINIGSEHLVTVDELVDIIAKIAGKTIRKRHDTSKPQGVRGRNCDSSLAWKVLGWQPKVPLEVGLEKTYKWIEGQVREWR